VFILQKKKYFSKAVPVPTSYSVFKDRKSKISDEVLFPFFNLKKPRPSVPCYQLYRITVLNCSYSKVALFIIIHLLSSNVPMKGFNKHNMHNFKHNV